MARRVDARLLGAVLCVTTVLGWVSLIQGDDALPQVNLGLLMPFPEGDSAITRRIAQEWTSAAKVAVAILSQKYPGFQVNIFKENSHCYPSTARDAAQRLLDQGVVGVVGPACSVAAQGALEVLGPAGVPLISFSATAPDLGTSKYPTFFRTAFSDEHQAEALVQVAKFFSMKTIYFLHTQEIYGNSFSELVAARGAEANLTVEQISVDYGHSGIDYKSFFHRNGNLIEPSQESLMVLATTPQAAEGLWKAAESLDLLKYPWWYVATDGAVVFDLVGEGDDMTALVDKLQGEIGISPYLGESDPSSPAAEFLGFWKNQSYSDYPGLLTLEVEPRFLHPRAYSTSVIDAIWSFYEAFAQILFVQKQGEVKADAVLQCMCNENCLNRRMTTGQVSYICDTGERNTQQQSPQYSFVNLVGLTWEPRGSYSVGERGLRIGTEETSRPGPIPDGSPKFTVAEPAGPVPEGTQEARYVNQTALDVFDIFHAPSGSPTGSGGGLSPAGTAMIVIASLALVTVVVLAAVWLRRRRHEQKALAYQQFVHVLPESYAPSFPLFSSKV